MNVPTPNDKEEEGREVSKSLPTPRSERYPCPPRRRKSTGERHHFDNGEFFFAIVKKYTPESPTTSVAILKSTEEEYIQAPNEKKFSYP